MSQVVIPGARDVRGTLDVPAARGGGDHQSSEDALDALVIACPPHPQHGGSRSDGRLVAVADALTDRGIACLRFDYGPWDGGEGEREDVRNAVRWATDRADRVGLFGYSFGAGEAILAAATDETDSELAGVSVLAPPAALSPDLDVVDAFDRIEARETPAQVIVGSRDDTVDWEPVADRTREYAAGDLAELPADHFFLGTQPEIATSVAEFFECVLEA